MVSDSSSEPARAYWITTGLFCLVMTGSGIAHALHLAPIAEGMQHLGYPIYVSSILGVAKLLGVVALLAPSGPVLEEWAYAGFGFNLLGAFASHTIAGDPIGDYAVILLILGLGAASYHLRPADRGLSLTLGFAA